MRKIEAADNYLLIETVQLKVLCTVCNIASRGKCWNGKVFEDGGGWPEKGSKEGKGQSEGRRESFNKSMNIVNSSTLVPE